MSATPSPAAAARSDVTSTLADDGEVIKLLLVEDDEFDRTAAQRMLARSPIQLEVERAASAGH